MTEAIMCTVSIGKISHWEITAFLGWISSEPRDCVPATHCPAGIPDYFGFSLITDPPVRLEVLADVAEALRPLIAALNPKGHYPYNLCEIPWIKLNNFVASPQEIAKLKGSPYLSWGYHGAEPEPGSPGDIYLTLHRPNSLEKIYQEDEVDRCVVMPPENLKAQLLAQALRYGVTHVFKSC